VRHAAAALHSTPRPQRAAALPPAARA
jgi:hypothetical protein